MWLNKKDEKFFESLGELGLREDVHEPDNLDVTASVQGRKFDNAGFNEEKHVVLKQRGREIGRVNLATLIAMGWENYRERKEREENVY